jgi:murein DD-endopeptidase MepM/ murein hydrolase activator NlpD
MRNDSSRRPALALLTTLGLIAATAPNQPAPPTPMTVAASPVAPAPHRPARAGSPAASHAAPGPVSASSGSALPASAAASAAVPARPGGAFGWPLAPPHPVLRPFEAPSTPYGPGHRGVDLGGTPGEPALAAGAGVVVFAGQLAGRGVVSVDHPGGLRTTYEPLIPAVTAGQRVAAGTPLGQLVAGHPECPAAACLHWGVRRGTEYLDPLALVSSGRVRLLPWPDE